MREVYGNGNHRLMHATGLPLGPSSQNHSPLPSGLNGFHFVESASLKVGLKERTHESNGAARLSEIVCRCTYS